MAYSRRFVRVNRLDGEDKDYGYIVDYRDLFNSLESAITDYTSGALDGYDKKDIDGLLSNRIDKAREDLDEALERIRALCEPVEPPKNTLQYQKYFCAAEQGNADQIKDNEPKRVELYKAVSALARCYGNLANEMEAAGYTDTEAAAIKDEVAHYANVRDEVKLGAGEDVDFKQYEAGMRHLLDTYISAKPSDVISNFQDAGLIELIVNFGAGAIDKLPDGIKKDPEAVAETITNNIRKVIIDERPSTRSTTTACQSYSMRFSRNEDAEHSSTRTTWRSFLITPPNLARVKERVQATQPGLTMGLVELLFDYFSEDEKLAVEIDHDHHDNQTRFLGGESHEGATDEARYPIRTS